MDGGILFLIFLLCFFVCSPLVAELFTSGAFECKFVMATVPCVSGNDEVIVNNPVSVISDDEYVSATEDEAEL